MGASEPSEYDGRTNGPESARRRERQANALGPIEFSRGQFEHARFIASMSSYRMTRTGDIVISFTVPWEFRDQVAGIQDAQGLPVSIDVVEWKRDATHPPHDGEYADG